MLSAALKESATGRVIVVARDESHAKTLDFQLREMAGGYHRVEIVTARAVNPETMSILDIKVDSVLFDHFALESMYRRVLWEYHRFDYEPTVSSKDKEQ